MGLSLLLLLLFLGDFEVGVAWQLLSSDEHEGIWRVTGLLVGKGGL